MQSGFSIVPWISWREYDLRAGTKILLYEQRNHVYYILTEEAPKAWNQLCSSQSIDLNLLQALQILIEDGIIVLSESIKDCYDTYQKRIKNNIAKHKSIPTFFNKELRSEGYIFDAHWDITNKCNAKCIHCYNHNAHNGLRNFNSNIDELSFEEAKSLVNELLHLGIFRLVLSGGEALTKPYFVPLCQYIRQHNIQLIIYTNGLAFTEKTLHEIAILHPSVVCFSVYGSNSFIHDSITQIKGSYQKVLFALSYFNNHHIDTCHKNTILSKNFKSWKQTLEVGRTISSKSMLNCTIYPSFDDGKLSKHSIDENQLLELAMSPDSPIYYNRKIIGACNIKKQKDDTPCYSETNTIYINAKGEVGLCIAFPLVIASIREGNIRELKRNKKNEKIVTDFSALKGHERLDNWRSLKISDLKDCGNYDYCEFCIDVCPGDAYMITGDLFRAPENHCRIAKARFKAHLLNKTV